MDISEKLLTTKHQADRLRVQAYALCDNLRNAYDVRENSRLQLSDIRMLLDPAMKSAVQRGAKLLDQLRDTQRERDLLMGMPSDTASNDGSELSFSVCCMRLLCTLTHTPRSLVDLRATGGGLSVRRSVRLFSEASEA